MRIREIVRLLDDVENRGDVRLALVVGLSALEFFLFDSFNRDSIFQSRYCCDFARYPFEFTANNFYCVTLCDSNASFVIFVFAEQQPLPQRPLN